jgi:hypothetical protein
MPMRLEAAALEGLRVAESKLDRAARKIAGIDSTGSAGDTVSISADGQSLANADIAGGIVDLLEARTSYRANLRSLTTVLDTEKDLLDTLG